MAKKIAKKAKNLTRSVPAGRPNSIVVYISAQNAIEDPFFFLSVIDLTQSWFLPQRPERNRKKKSHNSIRRLSKLFQFFSLKSMHCQHSKKLKISTGRVLPKLLSSQIDILEFKFSIWKSGFFQRRTKPFLPKFGKIWTCYNAID